MDTFGLAYLLEVLAAFLRALRGGKAICWSRSFALYMNSLDYTNSGT